MPHDQLERPDRRVQFPRSGPPPFPGEILPNLTPSARERRHQAPHRHPPRPTGSLHQLLLGILQRHRQRLSRQLMRHCDHQRLQRIPRQRPTQLGRIDRQCESRIKHRQLLLITERDCLQYYKIRSQIQRSDTLPIDLHSRKLVGYAIADHMRTELVTAALDMALANRRPPAGVIFHSDPGAQYTSGDFDRYCQKNGIRRSLGRTGICYDNAVSESTFATYKKELIHTRPWPTMADLKRETDDWIKNYFNTKRRHSTLGYLTPTEYELGYRDISQLAA